MSCAASKDVRATQPRRPQSTLPAPVAGDPRRARIGLPRTELLVVSCAGRENVRGVVVERMEVAR
ncbi:hypothetical protein ABZ942_13540 [Nocardia sp. NPDC046473]|uniref:hypothetical protein n=1 Tax=Nocardia sp. NPDC046473 TaxID=3155733 RepID=UPI00340713E5